MKRFIFLALTVLLAHSFVIAAPTSTSGIVRGRILDDFGMSLPGACISIHSIEEGALVNMKFTDLDGNFEIELPSTRRYEVSVTMTGFAQHKQELNLSEDTLVLPIIVMSPAKVQLEEVTVKAQKSTINVQADKIVLNVENSIVNSGSSVLEILGRSPGVQVDQNDQISLKGRSGVSVMVDGKLLPASGSELADLLKNMPSSSVEKIEIISNPGARYDAAGTAGIINIRTKKEQRSGINGTVNISYAQGVYPKGNAGANLNYRNNKVNIYANYNYGYRYFFNNLKLDRRFYDTTTGKQLFRYDQNNYSLVDYISHTGSFGMDYQLSTKTTTGLSMSATTNDFNPIVNNNSSALGASNELLYHFNTKGNHNNHHLNTAINAFTRHTLNDKGSELTADIDYAGFDQKSSQHFTTTYTTPAGRKYLPDYLLKSNNEGFTKIHSFRAAYNTNLPRGYRMETGLKTSYVTADNKPLFYEMIEESYELDTKRSNHFVYQENISAAYINLQRNNKNWGLQLGLRAEQTNANWNQKTTGHQYDTSYLQLFPSLAVLRHINEQHDLGITLSRRIERPNYQQLNPFKYFVDKTTYREGNPHLTPASSYVAELSHTFNQKFITSVNYSLTDNVIIEILQPSENEDSVTVQTNKNLRRMSFVGLSGSYSLRINKWWNNVTGYNAYYAFYEGEVANTSLSNGKPTFEINTNNTFLLPAGFSAELSCQYQARQIYGFMDVQPVWALNAGIQRHLFDKQATIRINVQDIFWRNYPRATSTFTGYEEDFIAKRDTRQATISFIYRFGNKNNGPIRQRQGGAEEEKRRAGTGNA